MAVAESLRCEIAAALQRTDALRRGYWRSFLGHWDSPQQGPRGWGDEGYQQFLADRRRHRILIEIRRFKDRTGQWPTNLALVESTLPVEALAEFSDVTCEGRAFIVQTLRDVVRRVDDSSLRSAAGCALMRVSKTDGVREVMAGLEIVPDFFGLFIPNDNPGGCYYDMPRIGRSPCEIGLALNEVTGQSFESADGWKTWWGQNKDHIEDVLAQAAARRDANQQTL